MYAAEGGLRSPGQPSKFYAPVLILPIAEVMDDDEVDALIERYFQLGISRFELGQFLIMLGCKVNLTKFGRVLLQRCELGSQSSELSTGKRGMMLQIQQISSWQSVYSSEMGDPMPPQLPDGFQTIPMTAIAQAKQPAFKKLWQPVQTFQVTPPAARGMSPAGSATSSMLLGITAATYIEKPKPACVESPGPDATDRKRTEHQS